MIYNDILDILDISDITDIFEMGLLYIYKKGGIFHMIGDVKITSKFKPFPAYADRAGWDKAPLSRRQFYISNAQRLKGQEWPSLLAIRYMDFSRDGNRSRYEAMHFARRNRIFTLMFAECCEGKGEYIEDIINGIWLLCEESTWVLPAHINYGDRSRPPCNELVNIEEPIYIDLFSAETGALISWVYYFLGNEIAKISPLVKRRMELEVNRRILAPYLEHDRFDWMGLADDNPVNNWNPWINSNVLVAYLVFEDAFPSILEHGVSKTIRSANRFLHFYAEDGGCDEGPGYFGVAGASVFDFLEELGHVADIADIYAQPLIRNMASYIYKVYIAGNYFVNYADAAPAPGINIALLSRIGAKIRDDNLVGFAAYLRSISGKSKDADGPSHQNTLFRAMSNMFDEERNGVFAAPKTEWFGGIQVVTARDAKGSLGGLFFSAKGGNNAESHNHNDVGNFIVYCDGVPVVVDAGVEQYTKFTFNEMRYTLWAMQSCYHNTPTINGADQLAGSEYRAGGVAYNSAGDQTVFTLDIAKAYPERAGIEKYRREFVFNHGKELTVTDTYRISVCKEPLRLNLLLGDKPLLSDGQAILSRKIALTYDGGAFDASVEEIKLSDVKMHNDWNRDCLYRLCITAKILNACGSATIRFNKI